MTRLLYRFALWLHPPSFRRHFGDQMLCVFDEAAPATGAWPLFADALISLARQWLLRSRLWMRLVATLGGLLTILAGTAIVPQARIASALVGESMDRFVVLAASICVTMISLILLLCVYWFRFSRGRRA